MLYGRFCQFLTTLNVGKLQVQHTRHIHLFCSTHCKLLCVAYSVTDTLFVAEGDTNFIFEI